MRVGKDETAASVVIEFKVRLGTESAVSVVIEFKVKVGTEDNAPPVDIVVAGRREVPSVAVVARTEILPPELVASAEELGIAMPDELDATPGTIPKVESAPREETGIEACGVAPDADIENPTAVVTSVVVGMAKSTLLVGVSVVDGPGAIVEAEPLPVPAVLGTKSEVVPEGLPIEVGTETLGDDIVAVEAGAKTDEGDVVDGVVRVVAVDVAALDVKLVGSP